jgi:hypothetical protein
MKHLSKVFTAGRMFFLDTGVRQCVFRVDHIRNKNSVIDITILAKDKEDNMDILSWGSTMIKKLKAPGIKFHEIFRKDLPLYIGMKCISNEFTKILRGTQ